MLVSCLSICREIEDELTRTDETDNDMDQKGLFYLAYFAVDDLSLRGNTNTRHRLCIVNMSPHPKSGKIPFKGGAGLLHASIVGSVLMLKTKQQI